MSVLFFDHNENHKPLYVHLCEEAHVSPIVEHNYQEFLKASYKDYLAVCVRGNFSDSSFASEVQQQVGTKSPLIAFSDVLLTTEQFKYLKQNLKIPYVTSLEITSFEFRCIVAVCKKKQNASEDLFQEMRRRFNETLDQKLKKVQTRIEEIEYGNTTDALTTFQKEIELLAELAYAHDYLLAHHYCRAACLEIEQAKLLKSYKKEELIGVLKHFQRKLQIGLQISGAGENMESMVVDDMQRAKQVHTDIYLIDQPNQCEEIKKWAKGCGINISVLVPNEALQAAEMPPAKIGLLCQQQNESAENCLQKFKQMQNKIPALKWGLIDFQGSLSERLEAMKSGVHFFFEKNIPLQDIFDNLTAELEESKKAQPVRKKIYYFAKEPIITKDVHASLASLEVELVDFTSADALFNALPKEECDLIILQEQSTDLESYHLMKTIHGDYRHKYIPVLLLYDPQKDGMLAAHTFDENEDSLTLPFSLPTLSSKVKKILEKHAVLTYCKNHDPDTHLFTAIKLKQNYQFVNSHCLLALIEVAFDQANGQVAADAQDTTILQIGHAVHSFFLPNEWVSRWSKNQFVLLFQDQKEQAEFLVKAFVQKTAENFSKEKGISLHYATASYRQDGSSLDELYHHASEKIASERAKEGSKESKSPVEDVLLVDSDAGLLELLDASLKNRALGTLVAKNANEALNLLQNRTVEQFPKLILSERLLDDMDGLELLSKIKQLYPETTSTFWFLSVRSSEEDVLRGLKLGAADYMAKPFNLTLLSEKIYNKVKK